MGVTADYVYNRSYRGKVKAVILVWSGTTADAYVLAPAVVFVDVFKRHGVEISMAEARGPMGLRKDLHIKALTEVPEIRERWKDVHGKHPGQAEVDAMFTDFVPMQLECLREYTTLLPGVAETTRKLQAEGIKLGSSTGFTRAMVDILEEDAKTQGYVPDASVAGDEVEHGARPKPFMVYKNLDMLDVHPIQSVVKVDDTVSGVGEALEAGCWGVGIARYSNYMDIDSFDHEKSLSEADMERRLAFTRETLRKAGAHYVVDTFDQLPAVIADVNARLARGEKP
jgi:phosphonoacetaldehyde hydrolase